MSKCKNCEHLVLFDYKNKSYSCELWECHFEPLKQELIIDKLKAEITTLQNRCYALTKGAVCRFCKYECEHKAETEDTDGTNE